MPKNNKKQQQHDEDERPAFENDALAFVYKSLINRDPKKRKIKPVESILSLDADIDDLSESDDSDYNPFNCKDIDNDDDVEIDSDGDLPKNKDEEKKKNKKLNDNDDISGSSSSDSSDSSDEDSSDESIFEDNIFKKINNKKKQSSQPIDTIKINDEKKFMEEKYKKILICSVCLGEQSYSDDELVECDLCGITVHELCYGIHDMDDDNESIHSNASSASTEPWFCDPCKAGIKQPLCELCPNNNTVSIYKQTDHGRWVHMICALYTQGVKFIEPEKLRGPNLSHIPFNNWGTKLCTLCDDECFAQTGVCIRCDAGFCRQDFHVTCAQQQGLLLTELRNIDTEETIHSYVAYCRLHSDREMARKKRKNFLTLMARNRHLNQSLNQKQDLNNRILNKLNIQREKFEKNFKSLRNSLNYNNLVPTKCTPKLLDSSPTVMKRLTKRMELANQSMGKEKYLIQEELNEIGRKWYVPPAFSIEFIGYYLDRNKRIVRMKKQLKELKEENKSLKQVESKLFAENEKLLKKHEQINSTKELLMKKLYRYLSTISLFNDDNDNDNELKRIKSIKIGQQIIDRIKLILPSDQNIFLDHQNQNQNKKLINKESTTNSVINNNNLNEILSSSTSSSSLSLSSSLSSLSPSLSTTQTTTTLKTKKLLNIINEFQMKQCATCKSSKEPHLMALCDRCRLYYHLQCLDPPLRRMPKKTRFGGWQCSNCTENEDVDDDDGVELENNLNNETSNDDDGSISTRTKRKQRLATKLKSSMDIDETSSNHSFKSETNLSRKRQNNKINNDKCNNKNKKRKLHHESTENSSSLISRCSTKNLQSASTLPLNNDDDDKGDKLSISSSIDDIDDDIKNISSKSNVECTICKKQLTLSMKKCIRCDNCNNYYHYGCLQSPSIKNPRRRGYTWCCFKCETKDSKNKTNEVSNDKDDKMEIVMEQQKDETKLEMKNKEVKNEEVKNEEIKQEQPKQQKQEQEQDSIKKSEILINESSSSNDSIEQPVLTIDDDPPLNNEQQQQQQPSTSIINDNVTTTTTKKKDKDVMDVLDDKNDVIFLGEKPQQHQQEQQKQKQNEIIDEDKDDDDGIILDIQPPELD